METAVKDMPILDYSVSQNTLDNVFINFVKNHYQNSGSNAGVIESSEKRTHSSPTPTAADTANSNV